MDEAMLKSGQFPNVAIMAGSDPKEVMREYENEDSHDALKEQINRFDVPKSEEIAENDTSKGVLNILDVQDTREKLEADIRAWHRGAPFATKPSVQTLLGWLDRQAAITERECMKQATTRYIGWDCAECAEGLGKELDARCDKLKERIAELTAEVEKHRQRANDAERGVLSDEWYVARDRYEDDIAELTAERDHFRKHVNHLMALIADIARKQPYTFDPEAPYMTLDTIGDYLDELHGNVASMRAERDEFSLKLKHEMELNRDNRNAFDLERIDELTAERDQLKADLKTANDTINTLRASVAGLKETVEKLGAQ